MKEPALSLPKGRYAGISMRVYGAILPGAARLARLPAGPSAEATRRLKVIGWYEEHGGKVRLTARHFGFSPDTVSRWVRAYEQGGVAGLEPRSTRPKRVRQPQTPLATVQRTRPSGSSTLVGDERSCWCF